MATRQIVLDIPEKVLLAAVFRPAGFANRPSLVVRRARWGQ